LLLLALGLAPLLWPAAFSRPLFESNALQYLMRAVLVPLPLAALFGAFATFRGERRERILFLSVALLAALFCEHVHHQFVDKGSYFGGGTTNSTWQKGLQGQVLSVSPGAIPHSYRFLSHTLIAHLQWLTGSFEFSRGIFRIVCNVFFFAVVLRYARLYLEPPFSVLVVALTVMIYPITIAWYGGQPVDPLSHLSFVLCLYCLAKNVEAGVGPTLALGVLAKESVAAVSVCRAFYGPNRGRAILLAGLYFAAALAVVLIVRLFVNRGSLSYGGISGVGMDHIWRNLQDYVVWFPQYLFTLGIVLPGAWLGWPLMDRSFRLTCLTLTFALVGSSALFSWLGEARNLMPAVVMLLIVNARYFEHRLLAKKTADALPRPFARAAMTWLRALGRQQLRARFLAVMAFALLLWAWSGPAGPADQYAQRDLSLVPVESSQFAPIVQSDSGAAPTSAQGGVFALDPAIGRYFWGSYLGGDGFTGRLTSGVFPLEKPLLYIPVIGYPAGDGLSLSLEVLPEPEQPAEIVSYHEANPGESSAFWRIDASGWTGRRARLLLVDNSTGHGGWLGFSQPVAADRDDPPPTIAQLDAKFTNYAYFFLCGGTIAALLLLPGCVVGRLWPHSHWAESALRPLVGLLVLGATGLILWLVAPGPTAGELWRHLYFGLHAAGALLLIVSPANSPMSSERSAWWCYASIALVAGATAAMPLPMVHETAQGTTFASRMVASPGDHVIPYCTAAYFARGYDGIEHKDHYFGTQWSLTSRGPLAAFGIDTVFGLFRLFPPEPLGPRPNVWPAETDAFFLSRWVGILTNGLVVFGAVALARSIGIPPLLAGLPWLVISPLVVMNTVFIWPKLLATYFVLLAIADVVSRRSVWRIGCWGALAYYSHPVGGLMLPAVAILLARQAFGDAPWRDRNAWKRAVFSAGSLTAMVFVLLAPWFAFKLHLGHPDLFLRYPLGGGRGTSLASGIAEWIHTRWSNLWHTFVPGAFLASEHMHIWEGGALSSVHRWIVNYQKTLFGQMGWIAFALGVIGWWRGASHRSDLRRLLAWCVAPALGSCLVFWGYSADGLGRNCLEPITAILLVLAFAGYANKPPWLVTLALPLAALETLSVIALTFVSDDSFRIAQVGNVEVWLGTSIAAALFLLVCCAIQEERHTVSSGNGSILSQSRALGSEVDHSRQSSGIES
jgi:hypothetical protein